MKLIKYKDKYDSQFEIEGFAIIPDDSWARIYKIIDEYNKPIEIKTNRKEKLTFKCGRHFLNHLTVKNLDEQEAKFLLKTFKNSYGFGWVIGEVGLIICSDGNGRN